jgi:hypothetical protein
VTRFTPQDREKLEQLVVDPECEPSYELLKSCLVWPDERAAGLTKEGYELLCDLWIVRGFIHNGVLPDKWGLDPAYFREVWQNALVDVPGWPGFKRLELSEHDREYLSKSVKEAATEDY